MITNSKYYCDTCEEEVHTRVENKENTFEIKNTKIRVKAYKRLCIKCNSDIYDYELDNEISKIAIKSYNYKFGIKGNDIKELRKQFNISQETLGKIIGVAKKTINSYENCNSIPNEIYQTVLKSMILDPLELIKFAEINIDKLSNYEKKTIFNKYLYNPNKSSFNSLVIRETSEYTGYTKSNPLKILNIIRFFTKEGIGKTKLAKALFLLDAQSYSLNLKGITGLQYIKAQHGPMPKTFGYMLESLINDKIIYEEIIEKDDDVKYMYFSIDEFDKEAVKEELDLLNKIFKYINSNTASKISDFTHTLKVYCETEDKELISFDYLDDFKLEEN